MRTRLKLAFALIGDPPILLLDEPTANLDVDGVAIVEDLVFSHRARNGVVVIGTNEPREVEWGDRLIRLGETESSPPRT
jgi:ABC-type multidrug transport system ATPase subunit